MSCQMLPFTVLYMHPPWCCLLLPRTILFSELFSLSEFWMLIKRQPRLCVVVGGLLVCPVLSKYIYFFAHTRYPFKIFEFPPCVSRTMNPIFFDFLNLHTFLRSFWRDFFWITNDISGLRFYQYFYPMRFPPLAHSSSWSAHQVFTNYAAMLSPSKEPHWVDSNFSTFSFPNKLPQQCNPVRASFFDEHIVVWCFFYLSICTCNTSECLPIGFLLCYMCGVFFYLESMLEHSQRTEQGISVSNRRGFVCRGGGVPYFLCFFWCNIIVSSKGPNP